MSFIIFLKILSITLVGFFTVFGLINPYKDKFGYLTSKGKIALAGSLISTLITLTIFLFDSFGQKKDIHEIEKFPLDNLSMTIYYRKEPTGVGFDNNDFFDSLKNFRDRYKNMNTVGSDLGFPGTFKDSISIHVDSSGKIGYFTYCPRFANKIPGDNKIMDNEIYGDLLNKSAFRGVRFSSKEFTQDDSFPEIKNEFYDLVVSQKQIGSNIYKIYPPDYYAEKIRNFELDFTYNPGVISSFRDLSKYFVIMHISSKYFSKLIIRNKKGQSISSDPSSIKYIADKKSGKDQYFVVMKLLDVNTSVNE